MIITLPGFGGSGPAHWQTLWEKREPEMKRFQPQSWDEPQLPDWLAALDRAVAAAAKPPVLVAHSLSCLLVAHWQAYSRAHVAGALLVAVPDPGAAAFPAAALGFSHPPREKLRFPALMLASTNDEFGTARYAAQRAQEWGSGFIELGALGHINGASGLGAWDEGRRLLTAFMAGLPRA